MKRMQLACVGVIHSLEIDTNHFKGNCPESCVVEGLLIDSESNLVRGGEAHPHMAEQSLESKFAPKEELVQWEPILPRCGLKPHCRQYFKEGDLAVSDNRLPSAALTRWCQPQMKRFSHVKITIFPDGGVSRLRVTNYN